MKALASFPRPEIAGRDVARLVETHEAPLARYLVYLGCPAAEVPDLVQESFLAFLRSGAEDRGAAATGTWLRTTARRLFLRWVARQRVAPRFEDLDAADRAWEGFERGDGGRGYLEALRECVRALGERARRALDLQYRDRLSRREIADALGLGEAGAKSLLERTRSTLRDCVARRLA